MIIKMNRGTENGSLMVVTLAVLVITSTLALSLLTTGVLEFKSSHWDGNLQQAQQGADAAIEWGLEFIYMELTQPEYLNVDELPLQLACGNTRLDIGAQGCQASVGPVVKISEAGTEPNECVYGFIVSADYDGAARMVEVAVTYGFSGGYEIVGEDGGQEFVPRVYQDRGQISSYQYIFE